MKKKVTEVPDVSSKLDIRVDPTDLASPRANNETAEEVEETSRKFKKSRP